MAGVLGEVASALAGMANPHPLRVCIDGRTACGKTTFADALAAAVEARAAPRAVIRTSIDGFHNPRAVRYARGRMSPEGYYHDARNLPAVIEHLLAPLGPGGTRRYRTEVWDLAADAPSDAPVCVAAPDAVLIVDGTFLNRPELAPYWDVRVFLEASEAAAIARCLARDAPSPDARAATEALYRARYLPAFTLYEAEARPAERADFVISMENLAAPIFLRRPAPDS